MKRVYIHLSVAALLLVVALVGYGLWYAQIRAESVTLAALEAEVRVKGGADASVPKTQFEEDEALVDRYFVSKELIPSFINDLEARGRAQGATITVTSVAQQGTGFAVALTAKGSFDAVARTVGVIEYAPYHLTLSSMSVVREITDTWRADVKLTVSAPPAL
jgi:hypothetical protein